MMRFLLPAAFGVALLTGTAPPASSEAPEEWNCMLHAPRSAVSVPSGNAAHDHNIFILQRQGDGSYKTKSLDSGGYLDFKLLEDSDQALVVAGAVVGIGTDSVENLVGSSSLVIDKRTHLARQSFDFLTGYPDSTFYGTCLPGASAR